MQITRYYGPRERPRDRDNLHGGAKPLRDALVRSGYLAGDGPDWLEEALVIETRSATGKPSIVVAIWPLKGSPNFHADEAHGLAVSDLPKREPLP
jgi:hypothetical protein